MQRSLLVTPFDIQPKSSRSHEAGPSGIWMTEGGLEAGLHFPIGRNKFMTCSVMLRKNNKYIFFNLNLLRRSARGCWPSDNIEFCRSILNLQSVNGSMSNTFWPISIENYSRAGDKVLYLRLGWLICSVDTLCIHYTLCILNHVYVSLVWVYCITTYCVLFYVCTNKKHPFMDI